MLYTKRLIIRPVEMSDYDDICEYGLDEEIGRFLLHWPKTNEDIKTFINDCIIAMSSDKITWYEYVMQLKDSLKVIGNISIDIKGTVGEIGWVSNKDYWNKGYMSEAVEAVIEHAFCDLDIHRIIATCSDKNIASYKVMEKCNMIWGDTDYDYKELRHGEEIIYNKLHYYIDRKSWFYLD